MNIYKNRPQPGLTPDEGDQQTEVDSTVPGPAAPSKSLPPISHQQFRNRVRGNSVVAIRAKMAEYGWVWPDGEGESDDQAITLTPADVAKLRKDFEYVHEMVFEEILATGVWGDHKSFTYEELERERKIDKIVASWDLQDEAARRFNAKNQDEPFVWTTAAQRRERPQMQWFIKDIAPAGGNLCVVFGDTGSYKTFTLIDLALSVTNGLDNWMGWDIVPDPAGKVRHAGFIFMEGATGAQARINAWLEFHGPDTTDDFLLTMENQGVNISAKASMEALVSSIKKATVRDEPFNPAVLVVDTQGLALGGADEYNRPAMRSAYALSKKLAVEYKCLVILVTHPGHTNKHRPAGASTQEQDADTMLRVASNTIEIRKMKEAERGVKRMFVMEPVGESLVARWIGEKSPLAIGVIQQNQKDNAIVKAVRELQVEKPNGVSKSAVYEAVGGNRNEVMVAIDQLLAKGRLQNNAQTEGQYKLTTDEQGD